MDTLFNFSDPNQGTELGLTNLHPAPLGSFYGQNTLLTPLITYRLHWMTG